MGSEIPSLAEKKSFKTSSEALLSRVVGLEAGLLLSLSLSSNPDYQLTAPLTPLLSAPTQYRLVIQNNFLAPLYSTQDCSINPLFIPETPVKAFEDYTQPGTSKLARSLFTTYGIAPILGPRVDMDSSMVGNAIPEEDQEDYLHSLQNGLSKYPPELVRKSRVYRIYILKNYQNLRNEESSGTASFDRREMYLNGTNQSMIEELFHHEFFHLLESRLCHSDNDTTRWAKINPRGLSTYRGDRWRDYQNVPAGFINRYSVKNVPEDKASIHQRRMVDQLGISDQAEHDPILWLKLRMMNHYFYSWTHGRMNQQFWKDLENNRVTTNYWLTP